MTHKTPQVCPGGCCDDGCPPGSEPVVTGIASGGNFDYTVANATFAEVRLWCPTAALGPPTSTIPVTLDVDGNASGSIYIDVGCVYCIYASNDCGEATACQDCDIPCCTIKLEGPYSGASGEIGTGPGQYRVRWTQYFFNCSGGWASPITSITINGSPVTGTPGPLGSTIGSFIVNFEDSPTEWCIRVTNDCGVSSERCIEVPCCWRTNALVLESMSFDAVYSRTCTWSTPESGYGHGDISETVTVNGLDGINGTYILPPDILTGDPSFKGIIGECSYFDFPIRLGVFGTVERRYVYTTVAPSTTDGCGVSWIGNTQKEYTIWTGEYALLLSSFGQEIVMIPSSKQSIVFKGYSGVPCRAGPFLTCPSGSIEWSEDSRYCLKSMTPPVGVHVATLVYSGYGTCPLTTMCDEISDFCYACVNAGERTAPWGFLPAGYPIGCNPSLGSSGVRTCDNGVVDPTDCGCLGYGMQRRVYSVKI